MGIISQDTFTRANQSGFGTASGGGTWTTKTGTPTLSILSNTGKATGTTGDIVLTLGATAKNVEAVCNLQSNDMPNCSVILYARYIDNNNFYRCGISGSGTLFIDKKSSGTFTGAIGSATKTINSNTVYGVRFHVSGTNLLARSWTGTEPGTWDINITDTSVVGAGNVGVGAFLNVATDTSQYDHFVAMSLGHLLISDGYGGVFS